jgi:hypothetical protein
MATPKATPQLRALIKQVEGLMKEMDSLRGKAEIPTWEKKELKEQRALARGKKAWAEKQLAALEKTSKPKVPKTPPAPKTVSTPRTPRGGLRGGMGGFGGGSGLRGSVNK